MRERRERERELESRRGATERVHTCKAAVAVNQS